MAENSAQGGGPRYFREMAGLFLLFMGAFTAVSLATYDYLDPSLTQHVGPGHEIRNMAGRAGAYWAGFLVDICGVGAFFLPLWFVWLTVRTFVRDIGLGPVRWCGIVVLFVVVSAACATETLRPLVSLGQVQGGGYLGRAAFSMLSTWLGGYGGGLLLFFLSVFAVQLLFGLSFDAVWGRAGRGVWWLARACWTVLGCLGAILGRGVRALFAPRARRVEPAAPADPERTAGDFPADRPVADEEFIFSAEGGEVSEPPRSAAPDAKPAAASHKRPRKPRPAPLQADPDAPLPPLDLLSVPPPAKGQGPDPEAVRKQGESLAGCLADFDIKGELQRIVPGPVVTMFEFKPAPGIKISRIAGLSDDLALAMKALAVRIEAPIPGRDTVGVEIPNAKRQTVYLREILESEAFTSQASKLTLAIGKDIQGRPQVADLAKMPHLLVAGATGSGKSVCINGILLSILYKARPDEVKLLLVDPKRIELSVYNDLPHLVHPVVTEMSMAKSALDWAVHEMDRRYEAMARLGVRNIAGYWEKLEKMGDSRPDELADLTPMPYLVIIIDELADLMMTAAKEVEISIVRLAQLARAAGIHLILATQRPSVDVVTGLIKANFPTRISFQVTSKHDSRTILDTVGAEHLLGRGDMLFKPSGGKMSRMHGAFVSDEETAEVVEFWKQRAAPGYELDFSEWQKEAAAGLDGNGENGGDGGDDTASDPIYPQAVDFVMEQGRASISLIQRRFRIGFNRAARFIEQMERDGMLGPQEGSKPRAVLRGKD
ncbi:MAG: DNA translocase FtsK 4TM domain-containing protein [Desulfovibrionaceae bacterium]|nr:DNA translocase FtsK 4TM domain-containing protein [Desulfovibrionaceae bacterium]